MRVLLTGHDGYIGTVASEALRAAGHEVLGLDAGLFAGCGLAEPPPAPPTPTGADRIDVRDVTPDMLRGIDAVVHLAALSNDPLGTLDEDLTYAINHRASVQLARAARDAGVERFVFASSCSLYGAAGDAHLDETAGFAPITAYGASKVRTEQDVAPLASDDFSPTFMRNATVFGASPRLRGDVVVNNLTAVAFATGHVLMKSDGTPWRPLVHVRDVARSIVAVLAAPREAVHAQSFNVGRTEENYRISEVAEIVREHVPGTRITYADGAGPDPRCYRVDCSKLAAVVPDAVPRLTVADGVRELLEAFAEHGMTQEDLEGPRYTRLARITALRDAGELDPALRWTAA